MIYYVGGFPPPYGGVTVKNSLLAHALEEKYPVELLDTSRAKRNPLLLLRQLAIILTTRHQLILAPAGTTRRKLVMLLRRLRPRQLSRTLVIVMGGSFHTLIAGDEPYIAALKRCRQLFVESDSMVRKMAALGITNVSVYPNCRPDHRVRAIRPTRGALKCVFFSLISPDKGVDLILTAAASTPEPEYHFYGPIEPGYEETFHAAVDALPNCHYHGVFPGNDPGLYPLLNTYDLLLLPTKCTTEGIPGILVESKLAGIPAIVSDVAYNRELVADGEQGVVLPQNTAGALANALRELSAAPGLVDRLKAGALRDAENYLLQTHLPTVTAFFTD